MGFHVDGFASDLINMPARLVVPIPARVSFRDAACAPVAFATVEHMLFDNAKLEPGETILVQAGGSGIGTTAIKLAKAIGCTVITTVGDDDKAQKAKALGADHVINYQEVDFSKWAIERYGKPQRRSYEGGVDVVINFTGGDTWQPSLRCLKRGGKLLVCGATAGHDPKEDLRYVWTFELKIIGSNSFYDNDLKGLMDLIAAGKMKPVIDKVLPLEQAAEGLRLIQDREVFGKVIVAP